MSDYVYQCTAKGCDRIYRSPLKVSAKFPPTHEHRSKKVYTMKLVSDGET